MSTPKKILRLIRRAFRVQYRLSVLYHGDCWYRNTYGSNHRLLRRMVSSFVYGTEWVLYKKTLFGNEWRMVDYGVVTKFNKNN